jgi:hypothetical protein
MVIFTEAMGEEIIYAHFILHGCVKLPGHGVRSTWTESEGVGHRGANSIASVAWLLVRGNMMETKH